MNRKSTLLFTIILLMQIFSYTLNEAPEQIDREDPFSISSDNWQVSGRSNCGTDYNETSISTYTNNSSYVLGDNPELVFTIDCTIIGVNYTLAYKAWGWSQTGQANWLGGLQNISFTATATNITMYEAVYNLGVDNYSVNTTLRNTTYASGDVAYSGSTQNMPGGAAANFTVMNSTGGNNTGGNNTTTSSGSININLSGYTNLNQSAVQQVGTWASGATILGEFESSNLTYNDTYSMTWALLSGWSTTQIINQGNASWNAYSNTSTESVNFTLADGDYMFQIYLYANNGNYIDHDMSYMQVGNGSAGNNTGGNNTGGNNTGCGSDANYSSVYATVNAYQYWVNQTITASMSVNCEILNSSMFMNYWIYDSNNYTMAGNNQSWTGSNNSSFSWTTQGLSTGNYTFHANLYVNGTWVDSGGVSFIVTSNNTGGNNTGGNNSGTMESVWGESFATQNGSYSQIVWEAYNLVNDTNYNVTFNIWSYNETTNNSLSNPWNYTVFNSSSSLVSYTYNANNSTAEGWWTNTYTPTGCYYVSIDLFDNDDGMHFDNYGFDYDVGMDCSNNTGGNNTDGNNTGGNNTGCGYDANYSSVYAVVYYYQYVNQTITASMSVNCEILNSSMFMNYWIYDSNNYTMAGNNQSWTGSNSSSFSWTTQGLSTGNYTFHADLYVNGTWVNSDEISFIVMSNNTGGNNTGCGYDANYSFISTFYAYQGVNETITTIMYVNCEIVNSTMLWDYWITDSNGSTSDSGNYSWNGSWSTSSSYWVWNSTDLSAGNYTVHAVLYSNGTWINSTSTEVVVMDNTGGGNNTGGNNTGSMVSIDWINTTASLGGGDAGISVEHNGNWTAYWGITNMYTPTFPSWNYNNGWWNAGASGGLGTTTGNGDLTWTFQDMDQWGALAPPSCNVLMIALFDGNLGIASAQSTPASGDPVSVDYQTFEIGNINASDCNWDSSWADGNVSDIDMDGIGDSMDNCPGLANADQVDLDGDGYGDLCDSDIDGDLVNNSADVFPEDPSEWADFDGDGIGNNADTDDDNDGLEDSTDAFPEDSSEQLDTDGDGIGNNADSDDDGDGVVDTTDNCPLTPNSDQADADGDGIGTACDGMEDTGGNNTDETWEEACEVWEYWNQDLVDTTLPGNGCPDYIDESSTEDEDDESSGGLPSIGVIGTLAAIGVSFVAVIRREQEE